MTEIQEKIVIIEDDSYNLHLHIKRNDVLTGEIHLYDVDLYNPDTSMFHRIHALALSPEEAIGQAACRFKCSNYFDNVKQDQMKQKSIVRRCPVLLQGWGQIEF